MPHRIALATTDRLTLYQHFGQAKEFHIVDLGDKDYSFVEVRTVEPPCDGGQHNENAFDAVLEILHDCEAVVVGKIGAGAAEYLIRRNMRVFDAPGVVENVLKAMIEQRLLDKKSDEPPAE
ncbi:MAG: dinitrogenase iron-molybdenum cofactor biosynthesis protein [Clostridiales Family XIII bacterium]|jgi:predicted Fe-Mo cluster-binding NifX family protein|nr:dinitrogenase iron-molybdenum cofactor biosynthesis protein [Clostridiales Family XIII bacterium]